MREELLITRIPLYLDVLIVLCAFVGALVRLFRGEALTFVASAKELFSGFCIGMALTAPALWGFKLPLWMGMPIAFLLSLFSSLLVSIVEKKLGELRDMKFSEIVKVVFTELIGEIKRLFPGKTNNTPPN
ncbi:hypothetical protein [Spirosoma sordidisoli]|uniref:Uncharacterized protein n=1 Tax=Spirosoma sordidisoli TaxID=2502893 RepID=A0A4Q2ULM7_9BACT|nr:hypothetical protein [Spirosoma sordidisoli]RYC69632.1 hypothetical protein EQG79_13610 [Spirosoma sordidisoli]